jgi:polyphosphate kinase 2 (PPK2 family)
MGAGGKEKESDSREESTDKRASKAAKPEKTEKLPRKDFENELEKLQAELVALQYRVQKKLKVIIFEGARCGGRGGAGTSASRAGQSEYLVALPAHRTRGSQLYLQRYLRHFPAGAKS